MTRTHFVYKDRKIELTGFTQISYTDGRRRLSVYYGLREVAAPNIRELKEKLEQLFDAEIALGRI